MPGVETLEISVCCILHMGAQYRKSCAVNSVCIYIAKFRDASSFNA